MMNSIQIVKTLLEGNGVKTTCWEKWVEGGSM